MACFHVLIILALGAGLALVRSPRWLGTSASLSILQLPAEAAPKQYLCSITSESCRALPRAEGIQRYQVVATAHYLPSHSLPSAIRITKMQRTAELMSL